MPFYLRARDYAWAPQGSEEIRRHVIFFQDDQHTIFRDTIWCPVYMFHDYYERNNLEAPPRPAGWQRNWNARVYLGQPRNEDAPAVAPEPPPLDDRLGPIQRAPWAGERQAQPQPPVPGNLFDAPVEVFVAPQPPPARPAAPRGEYKPPKDVKIMGVTKQPFFMPYDSDEEIRFRLVGSVIRFNGEPVYVQDIGVGGRGTYNIHYCKQDGTVGVHGYKEGSGFDLTPFPARYILNENRHRKAYWCFRRPIRGVYRQGACNQNTYIHPAGYGDISRIGGQQQIMDAYVKDNEVREVCDFLGRLTPDKISIALSNSVSVFQKKFKIVGAEKDVYGIEYEGLTLETFTMDDIKDKSVKLNYDGDVSPTMLRKLDCVGVRI